MVKELNINYENLDLSVLNNFVTITKKLDDKRVQYKIKHMSDIVIIALLGILADALNTQKETVKANQGTMYQEVSDYFHDNDLLRDLEYYSETEKSHSKFIKREYYMTNDIK